MVRTVPIPTTLVLEQNNAAISTLTGLQEWMPQTVRFHILDNTNTLFLNINDDPWTVEITVASGPGALDATSQQTSCEFATDGYCSIQFALDKVTTQSDGLTAPKEGSSKKTLLASSTSTKVMPEAITGICMSS